MGSKPKPSTILLLDGDLKLYRRAGIRRWQATFRLKSRWVRVSTGHHDMAEATIAACDLFYKYRYMEQHGLPTLTKSFKTVALWARDRMREETANGVEKKSFRDYEIVIKRYLIPYFDTMPIQSVTPASRTNTSPTHQPSCLTEPPFRKTARAGKRQQRTQPR